MKLAALVIFLALVLNSTRVLSAEQAIELETRGGMIKGSLNLPSSELKVPVVLIIAGSGPTDRDGNAPMPAGRNDSLKLLAKALSDSGVASVRYDKRGIAASSDAAPIEADLRFEDYVDDAVSWTKKLAKDPRFTGVIVLGHSEGSLIGILASQRSPANAFISVAGPASAASALLRRQLEGRLPPDLAERNLDILRSLEAGHTVGDVPQPLLALYRPSVQPYLISWFKYAPSDEISKLRIPCLLVQGSTDIQVSEADADALYSANKACSLNIIRGMNHIMKEVPPDMQAQIASYGNPALPLDSGFVQVLTGFLAGEQLRAAFVAPHH